MIRLFVMFKGFLATANLIGYIQSESDGTLPGTPLIANNLATIKTPL